MHVVRVSMAGDDEIRVISGIENAVMRWNPIHEHRARDNHLFKMPASSSRMLSAMVQVEPKLFQMLVWKRACARNSRIY